MKTYVLAGFVSAASAVQVAADVPLFHQFAGCVGRLSAEMEHAWLINDPQADRLETQRLTFLSLLDATMPSGRERDVLNTRIGAKMAQASLLTTATFGTTADSAARARDRAAWHVNLCRDMLLDS